MSNLKMAAHNKLCDILGIKTYFDLFLEVCFRVQVFFWHNSIYQTIQYCCVLCKYLFFLSTFYYFFWKTIDFFLVGLCKAESVQPMLIAACGPRAPSPRYCLQPNPTRVAMQPGGRTWWRDHNQEYTQYA